MYTVITRYIETIISYTNLEINFLQLWYTLFEPLCLITRSPFFPFLPRFEGNADPHPLVELKSFYLADYSRQV